MIFLDDNTTGDGLLSALHLLQVIVDTGKPLSELAKVMEVLPQALVNAAIGFLIGGLTKQYVLSVIVAAILLLCALVVMSKAADKKDAIA